MTTRMLLTPQTENAVLQARIDELKSEIENNKQTQRREIEQKFEALHAVNMHFSEISRTKEKFLHDAEKEVEEVFEEANLQSNAETRQLEVDHETVRVYLERLQAMERTLDEKLKELKKRRSRRGRMWRIELEERKHALLLRLSATDHVEDEIRNVQAKIDSLNARLREERGIWCMESKEPAQHFSALPPLGDGSAFGDGQERYLSRGSAGEGWEEDDEDETRSPLSVHLSPKSASSQPDSARRRLCRRRLSGRSGREARRGDRAELGESGAHAEGKDGSAANARKKDSRVVSTATSRPASRNERESDAQLVVLRRMERMKEMEDRMRALRMQRGRDLEARIEAAEEEADRDCEQNRSDGNTEQKRSGESEDDRVILQMKERNRAEWDLGRRNLRSLDIRKEEAKEEAKRRKEERERREAGTKTAGGERGGAKNGSRNAKEEGDGDSRKAADEEPMEAGDQKSPTRGKSPWTSLSTILRTLDPPALPFVFKLG
ncbi:hypothetical protein BLNAU_24797 [Blattamonas nauphoetae]|uniref:Uncharacterized protein n=1 Tax=Blattamonas nauphoetae TaxID=2049346 RepID=A0ABQ9WP95_9EUKA|nr:hypothetical protein BLNAU_24797 [Blattamonas nauphoetae]